MHIPNFVGASSPNWVKPPRASYPHYVQNGGSLILELAKSGFFHKINVEVVEKTLYALIKYADALFDEHGKESNKFSVAPEPIESWLYLAFAYYMAGFRLEYKIWQERGQQYFDKMLQEVEAAIPEQYKIQSIPMLSILYQNTEGKYYLQKLMEICRVTDHSSIPFALKGGMGELLMGVISSIYPLAIAWDEAFLFN